MTDKYDIAVLGGGPGGYVAAIRGAQLGKKVVLIEKDKLGGVCTNWGCIPTKYLLQQTKMYKDLKESSNIIGPLDKLSCDWNRIKEEKDKIVDRLVNGVDFLLKKNGVKIIKGEGFLEGKNRIAVRNKEEKTGIEADKIILATGSRPASLPFLSPNDNEVITSRQALELETIPEKLLVVGAGAIGLEIGTIFARLGSEVSVLEIMTAILPGSDKKMADRLQRILKSQGLSIFTQKNIEECQVKEDKVFLKGTCLKTQDSFEFEGDKVLLATGRKPNSEELKKAVPGLDLDKNGFIKVNSMLETSVPGIYAIGDLIGGPLLAHKASHEGILAAENASGQKNPINYKALPMAVYTEPEFASVGFTEQAAEEAGIKYKTGMFSLQANGRALTMGKTEGMVKIIADEKERIIGGHILAPQASDLIAEVTLALEKDLTLHELASCFHVHPTLTEAVMEAALKAKNEAIHTLNN